MIGVKATSAAPLSGRPGLDGKQEEAFQAESRANSEAIVAGRD